VAPDTIAVQHRTIAADVRTLIEVVPPTTTAGLATVGLATLLLAGLRVVGLLLAGRLLAETVAARATLARVNARRVDAPGFERLFARTQALDDLRIVAPRP